VSDSIVNQLLSKIDGVDSLNNILIIGMTNRLDMIDEAILRPGRLEVLPLPLSLPLLSNHLSLPLPQVHIEISLPDKAGRVQILSIKTLDMKKHKRITEEALSRLEELAERTENYTGAELEGLVRTAGSFALARNIDAASVKGVDDASLCVEWHDFERALGETLPAFGNKDTDEIQSHYRNGVCSHGEAFDELWGTLSGLVNQTRLSARTPLMSVLLEGQVIL
jgi:vesicle-fusing ATPase